VALEGCRISYWQIQLALTPSPGIDLYVIAGGAENAAVENVAPESTDGKLAMRY